MAQEFGDRRLHHVGERLRIHTHPEHGRGEHPEHQDLARADVAQRADLVVADRAEVDPLDHPQRIGRAEKERERGEQADPEVEPHRGEDHHPLADEARRAGQTDVGHCEEDDKRGEGRHRVDDAAEARDLVRVHAVVEHADAKEHRGRDEAVRDHLHQCAGDAEVVEDEEAERDETHVRDARVRDQHLHVLLHNRDVADVDDRDQREGDDQPRPFVRRVGRDRQRKAHEAVGAELEHDRGQHRRAAGRRFGVDERKPGVHRPHRHLDRERGEESEEQQRLCRHRQRQLLPGEDVEAAA